MTHIRSTFPGAWKSGLASELLNLEENINLLYETVDVHPAKIITSCCKNVEKDEEDLKLKEVVGHKSGFESTLDEYLLKINTSAHNICALISAQTDFELPIPVVVILRLAAKLGLLRWKNYKKNFANLVRAHIYSLSPRLIEINLLLFKTLIDVMGTNIIPFCPFINQTVYRIIEWTRTSNLVKFDDNLYYSMRTNLFNMILFIAKQLSLNINLEPSVLNSLIEVELIESLENLTTNLVGERTVNQEKYIIEALTLLEELFIIYSGLLSAQQEYKIKNYVVQSCIRIYRDFNPKIVSLSCRKQLLQLLQTIAKQPYATSTTEISHHIFELVMKVESDPELIRSTRRLLKVGLSHRPVIMSHLDGQHNKQFQLMMPNGEVNRRESKEDEQERREGDSDFDDVVDASGVMMETAETRVNTIKPVECSSPVTPTERVAHDEPVDQHVETEEAVEIVKVVEAIRTEPREQEVEVGNGEGQKKGGDGKGDDEDAEADERVLSMLDSFVNKLA